jgi:hypothetical protein
MEPAPLNVLVRIRPATTDHSCFKLVSDNTLTVQQQSPLEFQFDAVFAQHVKTEAIFQANIQRSSSTAPPSSASSGGSSLQSLIERVTTGTNVTIAAYGQTGSGKSFTMGTGAASTFSSSLGLVQLSVSHLFSHTNHTSTSISLQALEIYNERVKDLLNPSKDNLSIMLDHNKVVHLPEATTLLMFNQQQCMAAIFNALGNRATAATAMNASSSRSHVIITLVITTTTPAVYRKSKLSLVDLAGSERQHRTQSQGAALVEGQHINRSLSALTNIINTLSDQHNNSNNNSSSKHVNYRDSKLTRLLQDSIGGNALTALILCCSPDDQDAQESISTLRFGVRAKGVVNVIRPPPPPPPPLLPPFQSLHAPASVGGRKKTVRRLPSSSSSSSSSCDLASSSSPVTPVVAGSRPNPDHKASITPLSYSSGIDDGKLHTRSSSPRTWAVATCMLMQVLGVVLYWSVIEGGNMPLTD